MNAWTWYLRRNPSLCWKSSPVFSKGIFYTGRAVWISNSLKFSLPEHPIYDGCKRSADMSILAINAKNNKKIMTFLINSDVYFPLFAFSLFNQKSRIVNISM